MQSVWKVYLINVFATCGLNVSKEISPRINQKSIYENTVSKRVIALVYLIKN